MSNVRLSLTAYIQDVIKDSIEMCMNMHQANDSIDLMTPVQFRTDVRNQAINLFFIELGLDPNHQISFEVLKEISRLTDNIRVNYA